jgi:hypothetical protein
MAVRLPQTRTVLRSPGLGPLPFAPDQVSFFGLRLFCSPAPALRRPHLLLVGLAPFTAGLNGFIGIRLHPMAAVFSALFPIGGAPFAEVFPALLGVLVRNFSRQHSLLAVTGSPATSGAQKIGGGGTRLSG